MDGWMDGLGMDGWMVGPKNFLVLTDGGWVMDGWVMVE